MVADLDDDAAWGMTNQLGKEWSCYDGAVRICWPHLDTQQNPLNHRGEFKKLAAEHRGGGLEITDTPVILETKHLRATVCRTGDREFHLRGYLKDLAWQEVVFARAHHETAKGERLQTPKEPQPTRRAELFEPPPGSERSKSLGTAWIVPGDLFLQVELTDLGPLEAIGLWVRPRLPDNAGGILAVFVGLVTALDESHEK
jgi:hypothetical protein